MNRWVCLLPNIPSPKISIHVFISLSINLNTQQDFIVAFSIQHGFFSRSVSAIFLKTHNQMKGFEIKHKKVEVFAAVLLLLHFNSYQNQLHSRAPE